MALPWAVVWIEKERGPRAGLGSVPRGVRGDEETEKECQGGRWETERVASWWSRRARGSRRGVFECVLCGSQAKHV